jgi:hypothetical protein
MLLDAVDGVFCQLVRGSGAAGPAARWSRGVILMSQIHEVRSADQGEM